jgi:hypothetical protein
MLLCQRFSNDVLMPMYRPQDAMELSINLAPSIVYPKGQILLPAASAANDVQTLTIGGSPTGGTFPLTVTNPLTGVTSVLTVNFNSTVAQTQALINKAFPSGNVTVSGGTLPGATQVFTSTGALASMPVPLMTAATTGLTGGTPTAAVVHTTTGKSPMTFSPYTGSGSPTAILPYTCSTDAAGKISFASQAGGGVYFGETYPSCPAFFTGVFDSSQLVGYDNNALASFGRDLGPTASGRLIVLTGP